MNGNLDYENLAIVNEVGNFGELNIEDPTAKKVKKKKKQLGVEMDIDEMIRDSIEHNKNL